MSAPVDPVAMAVFLRAWAGRGGAGPAPGLGAVPPAWLGMGQASRGEGDGLTALAEASFRALILEALLPRAPGSDAAEAPPAPSPPESAGTSGAPGGPAQALPALVAPAEAAPRGPTGVPPREAEVIAREARRTGVDPDLLAALRRAENGGPGREFGVRSVAAPGLDQQARVAANTLRNTAARFARQGGTVVDPATGRYTEEFLRFFSARYAPRGAGNDPGDLNRFHAGNLIALYRRSGGGRTSS